MTDDDGKSQGISKETAIKLLQIGFLEYPKKLVISGLSAAPDPSDKRLYDDSGNRHTDFTLLSDRLASAGTSEDQIKQSVTCSHSTGLLYRHRGFLGKKEEAGISYRILHLNLEQVEKIAGMSAAAAKDRMRSGVRHAERVGSGRWPM